MVSQNVNAVLKQVQSLTSAERQQLIEALSKQPDEPARESRNAHAAALAARGIVLTIPPEPSPEEMARRKAWKPIKMAGGSLADDIIRDRR